MRVVFLGTGGYHPNERRHTAGVMLPEVGVLFDAGTSAFRVSRFLETESVTIFLSHAHLDHICGLTYFLVPLMQGDVQQATVYGTPKTLAAVRSHLFSEPMFPLMPTFDFQDLPKTVAIPGDGMVTHCPLSHPGGSTGFRVDFADRSMAYVTDTYVDGTYADFIRGVDLLIHECYYPDGRADWCEKTGHSHTTMVAKLARDAGVQQLFLTHIDPQRDDDDPIGLEAARRVFADVELAEDLREIDF